MPSRTRLRVCGGGRVAYSLTRPGPPPPPHSYEGRFLLGERDGSGVLVAGDVRYGGTFRCDYKYGRCVFGSPHRDSCAHTTRTLPRCSGILDYGNVKSHTDVTTGHTSVS